jgi:hypothetical protein
VAEDRSENGRSELLEMEYGSLEKGTIYSCRAHIATSFVPAARVIG